MFIVGNEVDLKKRYVLKDFLKGWFDGCLGDDFGVEVVVEMGLEVEN